MAYGGLLENNWKTHPNGENYSRWLVTRGRSDIQRTVDGVLRPQIDALNEEWRARKARDAVAKQFGEPGREAEVSGTPTISISLAILLIFISVFG
jgi:hypothetical protein